MRFYKHIVCNYMFVRRKAKLVLDEFACAISPRLTIRLLNYGTYFPLFIAYAYGMLRGTKPSANESKRLIALGFMTVLFDELTDVYRYSADELRAFVTKKELVRPDNAALERSILYIQNWLMANCELYAQSETLLEQILQAQIDSNEQRNENIVYSRLMDITERKGGFTMQLLRTAFDGVPTKLESEFLYQLGALGQLENDIFDCYKDFSEGIFTIPIQTKSISHVRKLYVEKCSTCFSQIQHLQFPIQNKRNFCYLLQFILARGMVALGNLQALPNSDQGYKALSAMKRELLISDMEKPINAWRLFRITFFSYKNCTFVS